MALRAPKLHNCSRSRSPPGAFIRLPVLVLDCQHLHPRPHKAHAIDLFKLFSDLFSIDQTASQASDQSPATGCSRGCTGSPFWSRYKRRPRLLRQNLTCTILLQRLPLLPGGFGRYEPRPEMVGADPPGTRKLLNCGAVSFECSAHYTPAISGDMGLFPRAEAPLGAGTG